MSSTFYAHPSGSASTSFTYDEYGNRKYTTLSERKRFLKAARSNACVSVQTFCVVLAFTGARLSEVLALTPRQIDLEAGVIVIRCLKKRRRENSNPAYRIVPMPASILRELDAVHTIKKMQKDPERRNARIWPWCRTTGWKRVKDVMRAAGITGLPASPKGLRHGFAVGAIVSGVPLTQTSKWLGHSKLQTTEIYTDAIGVEAQTIAKRMWKPLLENNGKT